MVLERRQFQNLTALRQNEVLVVNPRRLAVLYLLGLASKKLERIITHGFVIEGYIKWESPVYGVIFLRLPQSQEESDYMKTLDVPEVWEVDDKHKRLIVSQQDNELVIENGTREQLKSFQQVAGKRNLLERFPLFPYFQELPFLKQRQQVVCTLFEFLRVRFNEKIEDKKKRGGVVRVVSSDYLQLPPVKDYDTEKVIGSLVGDEFLKRYSRVLFGTRFSEKTSGLEFVSVVLRTIGEEALPYTIYVVGDGTYNPYHFKDYFAQIYPGLSGQFIGVSSSLAAFFTDKIKQSALLQDIAAKKPDLLLVGSVDRKQERQFLYELSRRDLNFGVGILLGGALDLQKRSTKRNIIKEAKALLSLFRM